MMKATNGSSPDPKEHTVGYGGYPNLLGEVELDASIMDGTTRRAGAVGALRGYRAAISVARKVMEELPHVLLVGEGAARFAAELGFVAEDLLTEEARQGYTDGLAARLPQEYHNSPIHTQALSGAVRALLDPEHVAGTVNFLAQDAQRRIASAVSTSGSAWKYPGRLGDTPIIGAGNYADDRYGAAACTGWGELAIRASTAHTIIAGLEANLPLSKACERAYTDLAQLDLPTEPPLHVVAINAAGNHAGYTTVVGRKYLVWAEGMTTFAELPCTFAPVAG